MIGKTLGHYQIIERLGEGGMGLVYKAQDLHLDRFVAIKVLPPEMVTDPGRKHRFIQEAKAASALNHPNIITIYDISADAGHDFIAMEYVEGKTLDQLIPRRGMRLNEGLKIAIQITDALTRAHRAGIIHRDLKPANIMVDAHGLVKVLDFGLAKLIEPERSEDASTVTIGVKTDEGSIVGTPAYMSPEQAEGKPVDARSDIFTGSVFERQYCGLAWSPDGRYLTVVDRETPQSSNSIFLLLICRVTTAQVATARLEGVVRDPEGSVVPGASVAVANNRTQVGRRRSAMPEMSAICALCHADAA